MMADARLVKDGDRAAQSRVAPFDHRRVFCNRHDVVGIADHMNQRDIGGGQRRKHVNGIFGIRQGFRFVLESVVREQTLPVAGAALTFALAAGPALEVADRRVAVDADDALRVAEGKSVGVETAAADADQRDARVESLGGHVRVKPVKMLLCGRAAEGVADTHVGVIETVLDQRHDAGAVIEGRGELHAPDPRVAGARVGGDGHPARFAVHREMVARETLPGVGFRRLPIDGDAERLVREGEVGLPVVGCDAVLERPAVVGEVAADSRREVVGPRVGRQSVMAEKTPDRFGGFHAEEFAVWIEPAAGETGDIDAARRTGGEQHVLVERHRRLVVAVRAEIAAEPVREVLILQGDIFAVVALGQRHAAAAGLVGDDDREALVFGAGQQSGLGEA